MKKVINLKTQTEKTLTCKINLTDDALNDLLKSSDMDSIIFGLFREQIDIELKKTKRCVVRSLNDEGSAKLMIEIKTVKCS